MLTLLAPVLLGLVAAGMFSAEGTRHLNRYAASVAFPALIVVGLADPSVALPSQPVAWLLVPASLVAAVLPLRALGVPRAGSLALVTVLGNTAYLGIPVAEVVLDPAAMGAVHVAVSQHLFLGLLIGPWLLLRWGEGSNGAAEAFARVARHPLFWAPWVGMVVRVMPGGPVLREALSPIGGTAAPVALFLVGVELVHRRAELWRVDSDGLLHLGAKLLWLPLLTTALVVAARRVGWVDADMAQALVLLSAMPPAVTTYALAVDLRTGESAVAQALVVGTVLSGLTLPLVVWGLPLLP